MGKTAFAMDSHISCLFYIIEEKFYRIIGGVVIDGLFAP
jgi:hypothetical protein